MEVNSTIGKYSTDLWGKHSIVHEHAMNGQQGMKYVIDFLQQQTTAHESFSKTLSKSSKTSNIEGIFSGNMGAALMALKGTTIKFADRINKCAKDVQECVCSPLSNFLNDSLLNKKKTFTNVQKLEKENQQFWNQLYKAKEKQKKIAKDAEATLLKKKKIQSKLMSESLQGSNMDQPSLIDYISVEQLNTKFREQVKDCKAAEEQYYDIVKQVRAFQKKYNDEMSQALDNYQVFDIQMFTILKTFLLNYVSLFEEVIQDVKKDLTSLRHSIDAVEPSQNLLYFVAQNKSSQQPVLNIAFEPYVPIYEKSNEEQAQYYSRNLQLNLQQLTQMDNFDSTTSTQAPPTQPTPPPASSSQGSSFIKNLFGNKLFTSTGSNPLGEMDDELLNVKRPASTRIRPPKPLGSIGEAREASDRKSLPDVQTPKIPKVNPQTVKWFELFLDDYILESKQTSSDLVKDDQGDAIISVFYDTSSTRNFSSDEMAQIIKREEKRKREIERVYEYIQTFDGRMGFAIALNYKRAKACLRDENFVILGTLLDKTLTYAHQNNDPNVARLVMNMCQTFYRKLPIPDSNKVRNQYLQEYLIEHAIWKDKRFWEAAFFESLSSERQKIYGMLNPELKKRSRSPTMIHTRRESEQANLLSAYDDFSDPNFKVNQYDKWKNLDEGKKQEVIVQHENMVFGLLLSFCFNMLNMNVSLETTQLFAEKMCMINELSEENTQVVLSSIEDSYLNISSNKIEEIEEATVQKPSTDVEEEEKEEETDTTNIPLRKPRSSVLEKRKGRQFKTFNVDLSSFIGDSSKLLSAAEEAEEEEEYDDEEEIEEDLSELRADATNRDDSNQDTNPI